MKFSKSLFLAFAGLGLFACSNEEVVENNQLPEGVGAVTINIQSPAMSRAIEDGTSKTTVPVKGDITITLAAETGAGEINLSAEQLTRVRDKDCVKNRVKRAKIVRFTLC